MANNVAHFAVHADDVGRARRFYEAVFGWRFDAWGPPGFYRISTGTPDDPGIEGALHGRGEALEGTGMRGFECTIAVDDLVDVHDRVVAAGGTVILDPYEIPGVGTLIRFLDTERNVVSAMRYITPPSLPA
ncbi:MAG: VOC family protein [Actinomycetota bacterium]|nr:VOC family protein [Actinomycetota bacterium]